MKAVALTLWIVVIIAEATANWYAIERLKREINHAIWFIPRLLVGALFLYWYVQLGYQWYWAGIYIMATHAMLFPEYLNVTRGKPIGYLGDPNLSNPNKSLYDKIVMRVIKYEYVWFWVRVIITLFAIGNMVAQGECTWYELNNGLCR